MSASAPEIQLYEDAFHAGEALRGSILVPADKDGVVAAAAQWFTEGKGTTDEGPLLDAELELVGKSASARRFEFSLDLPHEPWSYDGKIVKIRWRLVVRVGVGTLEQTTHHAPFVVVAPPSRARNPYRGEAASEADA